jgi:FKBP-type peptidyl-prolyl cis-trans isomerase
MIKCSRFFSAIAVFTTIILASSCLDDPEVFDAQAQWEKETAAIDSYIQANSFGMQVIKDTLTGVVLRIHEVGNRLPPGVISNKVITDYVGKVFPDGTIFDDGEDVEFALNGVIPGWTRAFSLLPQGSVADIFIPSAFAYGQGANGSIPGNSTLQFHVDFKEVNFTTIETSKLKTDTVAIDAYLVEQEITEGVQRDSSGLRYIITQAGTGDSPGWYDRVRVKYTIFEMTEERKELISFEPGDPISSFGNSLVIDYINGIKAALLKMNEGSKATLYVPSGLGYGPYAYYDPSNTSASTPVIPTNSNLIVELELIEIVD